MDKYASRLVQGYAKRFGLKLDMSNPTREQRIELAMELDRQGGVDDRWHAMEIMVGRSIASTEQTYVFLMLQRSMSPQDSRKFYEGFAESE